MLTRLVVVNSYSEPANKENILWLKPNINKNKYELKIYSVKGWRDLIPDINGVPDIEIPENLITLEMLTKILKDYVTKKEVKEINNKIDKVIEGLELVNKRIDDTLGVVQSRLNTFIG